ncbi:MAG: phosphonopyruvate decarboxylase [Candidatus Omnitrophica bacterium]|nr:phosphonopyruvate decarboxylase [Candidatus Omnitrophota bacterium]
MISAEAFISEGLKLGYGFYSGVPCSFLKPLINYTINHHDLTYLAAANEGDAVAIASGAALAGQKSVVIFQNSGLGNAVNPLTSLNYIFKLPILLIVTLRGEKGVPDEPQHLLMGEITSKLLESMQIPWEYFPQEESGIAGAWTRADQSMKKNGLPYALVMKKNSVEPVKLTETIKRYRSESAAEIFSEPSNAPILTRREALQILLEQTDPDKDLIVAGTGFNSRELYDLNDRPNQFYMVGSMGCASSIALGLAAACPQKNIIAVEGDGSMLMRMGAAATIGFYNMPNLKHLVLDNEAHESTGSQSTVSSVANLAGVAQACGYSRVFSGSTPEMMRRYLGNEDCGMSFLQFKIRCGTPADLPRPTVTPEQVKQRFMNQIRRQPTGTRCG